MIIATTQAPLGPGCQETRQHKTCNLASTKGMVKKGLGKDLLVHPQHSFHLRSAPASTSGRQTGCASDQHCLHLRSAQPAPDLEVGRDEGAPHAAVHENEVLVACRLDLAGVQEPPKGAPVVAGVGVVLEAHVGRRRGQGIECLQAGPVGQVGEASLIALLSRRHLLCQYKVPQGGPRGQAWQGVVLGAGSSA